MNECANLFSSEEEEINFYESHVGPLTTSDIEYGLTLKDIYESNERFCRLEDRRNKLQAHLKKYGAEIFSGYARGSLPPSFVQECKKEIVLRYKQKNKKGDLNELCPLRLSGFQKIASNVKGKPRGLSNGANMQLFSKARAGGYLYRISRSVRTNWNIYNFDCDDVINEAEELLAIRFTLKIWKRKKWPNVTLDDLLNEAENNRIIELQLIFERIYLLVLKEGQFAKLPRMKFHHQ